MTPTPAPTSLTTPSDPDTTSTANATTTPPAPPTPTTPASRSLTTPTAPELADVSAKELHDHLVKDLWISLALLLAEALFIADLTRDVLARILGADWEDYAIVPAMCIAFAVMLVAFFTAGRAGEASRRSARAMWIWLGIVASLGAGLFYARITHSAATGVARVGSGPAATTSTHNVQNLILAILLLAIYLATSALAFHSGRTWRHPVLRQMVTAKTRRDELIAQHTTESAMLQGLQADLGTTDAAIASLDEERATAIREATHMVYAAAAVALQRLAERLGRPDASGITRHRPDFGPLPYGLDLVPRRPGEDWPPPAADDWKKANDTDE